MFSALLFLLQAAAAQAAPDIELSVDVHADRVRIERRGEASLEVGASPDGGSDVRVEAPEASGRQALRNVDIRIRAEARLADPRRNPEATETPRPERR